MSSLQNLEVQDTMQCRDFANAVMNVRCGSHGAVDNTAVWYATFQKNPLSRSSGYNSRPHSTLAEVAGSPATVTHFY